LHEVAPDNHCYKWAIGDKAQVDAAFAKAAHITKLDLINNRLVPNPMEPRAAIGSYSRANDEYTLYVSNQNPHVERLLMTAFVMGLPEHKVRVIAPDVGGGFGAKIYLYAEDVCLTWASKKLNRNIKWTAERSESFVSDAHGRDHVSHAEMAMDKDGKFLALRVHTDANMGAYLSTFATAVPTILYATLFMRSLEFDPYCHPALKNPLISRDDLRRFIGVKELRALFAARQRYVNNGLENVEKDAFGNALKTTDYNVRLASLSQSYELKILTEAII
jgi:CO/xanthine dehydrogenase Mo-binding subunit